MPLPASELTYAFANSIREELFELGMRAVGIVDEVVLKGWLNVRRMIAERKASFEQPLNLSNAHVGNICDDLLGMDTKGQVIFLSEVRRSGDTLRRIGFVFAFCSRCVFDSLYFAK